MNTWPAHDEESNDFSYGHPGSVRLCSVRKCCGGKFQVGGGLVDALGDGAAGGRVEVGTPRERFSSGRGDGIGVQGRQPPARCSARYSYEIISGVGFFLIVSAGDTMGVSLR